MTVVDSLTGNAVSGLLIVCNPTAESHPSACAPVAFANPHSTPQAYHVQAGQGQECLDLYIGQWAAVGNTTLPPGGGALTAVELVDTVTISSLG